MDLVIWPGRIPGIRESKNIDRTLMIFREYKEFTAEKSDAQEEIEIYSSLNWNNHFSSEFLYIL